MVAALSDARELAVDLEHHSFRTFQGITCLMQVSDRCSDFLVDVLRLRSHIGPALAPLFADPQASSFPSQRFHKPYLEFQYRQACSFMIASKLIDRQGLVWEFPDLTSQ